MCTSIVLCSVYYTVSCFEVKTEPPDSDECPHDNMPWSGMIGDEYPYDDMPWTGMFVWFFHLNVL